MGYANFAPRALPAAIVECSESAFLENRMPVSLSRSASTLRRLPGIESTAKEQLFQYNATTKHA